MKNSFRLRSPSVLLLIPMLSWSALSAKGGSATWQADAASDDWKAAINWMPNTVPNGPSDVATFNVSNVTSIFLAPNPDFSTVEIDLDSIVFTEGASAYTLSTFASTGFTISGAGILNNSGVMQRFVNHGSTGDARAAHLYFTGNATVGDMITITNNRGQLAPSGETYFYDNSSAGHGTFINLGPSERRDQGGFIQFFDNSTAGNGVFTLEGGSNYIANGSTAFFNDHSTAADSTFFINGAVAKIGYGALVDFFDDSTLGDATFTIQGGTGGGRIGGDLLLLDRVSAGSATLIAQGTRQTGAGSIYFFNKSNGAEARVELLGAGKLYLYGHDLPGLKIGSIEGEGPIFLGANNLTVGSTDVNMTYRGSIQDGDFGSGGSLTKVGKGTLVLGGTSTYTGNTVVAEGTLSLRNSSGSATGAGNVSIERGQLTGDGIVAGAVTVGTGSGRGATLAPGWGSVSGGTLTILGSLLADSDATLQLDLQSNSATADVVNANGVTISVGASFAATDVGNVALPVGTLLIVVSNTSPGPIVGTFNNLADGMILTVGPNKFQANYEGGDGNDLTLTVVL